MHLATPDSPAGITDQASLHALVAQERRKVQNRVAQRKHSTSSSISPLVVAMTDSNKETE